MFKRSSLVLACFWLLAGLLAAKAQEEMRIFFDIRPEPQNQPVFDWLAEKDICWGIEVPWYTPESDVRQLRARGWEVLVHLHAHPPTLRRHWEHKGRPIPVVDAVLQKHLRAAKGESHKVNWMMMIEDDSCGVGHSQELLRAQPSTHQEAKQVLDRHLQTAWQLASAYPTLPKWGMCGFAPSTHAFAAQGLDWLILERANDDVDDLQTGIAFARGAARQHGCHWGLDLSLWWGVFYGCIQDLPPAFHKRHLYLGYFAGAQAFRIEGGDLFWHRQEKRLTALAKPLEEFAAFTKRFSADTPDVPVAIVLPEDHGWMTPPYWRIAHTAWNYARIPYRPGDRGIDAFFARAFPGSNFVMQPFPFGPYEVDDPPASPFSLSCVTAQFAPRPENVAKAQEPLPFGRFPDRHRARVLMQAHKMDPSPYRPMGDSRWGDIFDILTDRAALDVLKQYRAVVLLGQIKLTPRLKARLEAYVRQGGHLVCAAGVVGPANEDLTGLRLQPEFRVGRAWRQPGYAPVAEAYQHLPATTVDAAMDVRLESSTGHPLVTRRALGEGLVTTCTIPWYEGPTGQLSGPAAWMMDAICDSLQPVQIRGLPVEWLSTRGENRRTVVVANHNDIRWSGEVVWRHCTAAIRKASELSTGHDLSTRIENQDIVISLEIPPFDLRIVRLKTE